MNDEIRGVPAVGGGTPSIEDLDALEKQVRDELLLQQAVEGDFASFCEYCFTDTNTGEPWQVFDYQKEWIDYIENNEKMVIWAPVGSGKCLHADSMVYLANGGKTCIRDIKAGDVLLSVDEKYRLTPNTCLFSLATGEKEVFEIETEGGYKIQATKDHKTLMFDGYIALSELRHGDMVGCVRPRAHSEGAGIYWDKVKSIKRVGEEDTWDLQMADPDNNFVADGIVVHNSECMSMAYPIWRLGRNHNELIISASDTLVQAQKWMGAASKHIKNNERLKHVFPDLKPAPHDSIPNRELKWGENGLTVERERLTGHMSWQCCGSFGSVLGSRATLIIVDDVVDYENSRTPERMQSLIGWVESELLSRLFPGAQMIILGTTWAKADLMHNFSARPTFFSVRYSVEKKDKRRGGGKMDGGVRVARRSGIDAFLNAKRAELPSYEYARQYRNQIRDTTNLTFPTVAKCFHFLDTDNMNEIHALAPDVFADATTITSGVDLSSKTRPGNAIVTTAHKSVQRNLKDEKRSTTLVHSVVGVEFGSWTSPQTARALMNTEDKYGVDVFTVEDNGYQAALSEWMSELEAAPTVESFRTGTEKYDPYVGLPSLEAEFANEKWVIYLPKHTQRVIDESKKEDCECDYCRFAHELIYHPTHSSSDGVMALWFSRGKKKRKKASRMTVYNSVGGKLRRPSVKLGVFYKDNRISARNGFEFPDDADNIIQKWANYTTEEAEIELKMLKSENFLDRVPDTRYYLSKSEESLVREMIDFCKVLRDGE